MTEHKLRAALEKYIAWQYRQPGAKRFTLTDLRAALAASATDEGPRDDGAFTRLLRNYADRAHDNDTARTMVPEVVLRDAAAVIDDYRVARPAVPALDVGALLRLRQVLDETDARVDAALSEKQP